MLYRNKEPNKNKWNGLGGKIEKGETPLQSVIREIREEGHFSLKKQDVHFSGIVTWNIHNGYKQGMYSFLVDGKEYPFFEDKQTREGLLSWKQIHWIVDKHNKEVVENIPFFLPLILINTSPSEFHCQYNQKGQLQDFSVIPYVD